jgi:exodeoxyribonuclease V alpha subunit
VSTDLLARAGLTTEAPPGRAARLAELLPGEASRLQRVAVEAIASRRLAVISGGPGTGKTTTIARALVLVHEEAGGRAPLVALCAPTGKAAARLAESVRQEATDLDPDGPVGDRLRRVDASTIHRLLGWRPGGRERYRHHRGNPLPHDLVVVDETSMVGLPMMARLLAAVREDATVVLVGDADQLASIEAGSVLADVVGPRARDDDATGPLAGDVVVLRAVHRYGEEIGALADAVRRGDPDGATEALARGGDAVRFIARTEDAEDDVPEEVVSAAARIRDAAAAGDDRAAIEALGGVRVLCAHRRGPHGVAAWTERIERALAARVSGLRAGARWYVGRPLLVTRNDYVTGLLNGDAGVVVAGEDDRVAAAFERRGELARLSPSRLEDVETAHAMTIHKGQGSQFEEVVVVLPDPDSRILTRELLYTAITRARRRVTLIGTEEAVRVAVGTPVARASGLRERLWED